MANCDLVGVIANKPIVINVYLNAHFINNQFLVELNNRADNLSKKIIKKGTYTLNGYTDEYMQGFPFLTKVDMYKAVFTLLERNNMLLAHQINFNTHKLLFITSATVDIAKESACYERQANVCVEIDQNTIIHRNDEHNFVIIERVLKSMITTFKEYKCASCDNKIVTALTFCGRCGTKQNRLAK